MENKTHGETTENTTSPGFTHKKCRVNFNPFVARFRVSAFPPTQPPFAASRFAGGPQDVEGQALGVRLAGLLGGLQDLPVGGLVGEAGDLRVHRGAVALAAAEGGCTWGEVGPSFSFPQKGRGNSGRGSIPQTSPEHQPILVLDWCVG